MAAGDDPATSLAPFGVFTPGMPMANDTGMVALIDPLYHRGGPLTRAFSCRYRTGICSRGSLPVLPPMGVM
jgi:hypothetical protein